MKKYVDLNRLEFAVTYNCSSNCMHCFVDENSKEKYSKCINKNLAVSILEDLSSIYELESVMTFGGEPLLYPEVTCTIHKTAKLMGIKTRQMCRDILSNFKY